MPNKTLITTLASGWYRGFIPMFEYTARLFNKGCDVRVFTKEEEFPNHPDNAVGLLRFCLPNKYFEGYDYVYFTDVDFIFLPHKTNLVAYHQEIIDKTGQPYAGHRGPDKGRWNGRYCRMAGGAFMATQQWLQRTELTRIAYVNKGAGGLATRAHDEIYLYRMTKNAGCVVPEVVGRFVNGEKYNRSYRNIHLGDFKFSRRWTNTAKMKRRFLKDGAVLKYRHLLKDSKFLALQAEACKTPEIQKLFEHLNTHLARR